VGLAGLNPAKVYHYRAVVEVEANQWSGWYAYYGQDMLIPSTEPVGRSTADKLVAGEAI